MARRVAQGLLAGSLALLVGCGGGGGGGGSTKTANVTMTVNWGERSRVISAPSSARSAVVVLSGANPAGGDFSFTVNRDPSPGAYTGNYVSPNVAKTGEAAFSIRFYADENGTGSLVGSGSATVTIDDRGGGIGVVATSGTVASVTVGAGQVVTIGEPKLLEFEARTGNGSLLVLSPGSALWRVTLGDTNLRFENGLAIGLQRGEATVVAKVDNVDSAERSVSIRSKPDFIPLGTIAGTTNASSSGLAVSRDGLVVVGTNVAAEGTQGWRWTASTGMVGIGFPPNQTISEAFATNANGSAIAGSSALPTNQAFRWTSAGFTVLTSAGLVPFHARGMSSDGAAIVGFGSSAGGTQAYIWTEAGGVTPLGWLAGAATGTSEANGISDAGTTVVGQSTGAGPEFLPFKWVSGGAGLTALALVPGATEGSAEDISGDGAIIVGQCSTADVPRATLWNAVGTPIDLGLLPGGGSYSVATATNFDGSVVVGYAADAYGDSRAFVWEASTGMRDLRDLLINQGLEPKLRGWRLENVNSISSNGKVVAGTGFNPTGRREAFIAFLP